MMAEENEFVRSLQDLTAVQLMDKKDSIEKEIHEFNDILQTQKGVGMDGPLVDREGYPRSDIDVYAVRTARHKILCLQNDHKAVMAKIEKALYKKHAEDRLAREAREGDTAGKGSQDLSSRHPAKGFAKVNSVEQHSPAEQAGLLLGDVLLEFGSVNYQSFKDLQDVGTVMQHSQGSRVRVVVQRDKKPVILSLTPQQWSGRGLLGCNIVPL